MNQDENMNNGKYEEALERAKELHESGNALTKQQMEIVFPELKENKDERIRKSLVKFFRKFKQPQDMWDEMLSCGDVLAYLERQKEQKIPEPKFRVGDNIKYRGDIYEITNVETNNNGSFYYVSIVGTSSDPDGVKTCIGPGGEKDMEMVERYPTEYSIFQDTRKKLIALVEKFGQEEDKEGMLDYLETYQPVQSATEVKEFNFQPGDPDEKAIKRLKAMIYFAFDETSEVPMDEACALDDWLDDKCKPAEWSDSVAKEMFIKALERAVEQTKKGYELTDCDKHSWWEDFKTYSGINLAEWSDGKIPKDIEKDAVQFCFDKGLNVTPYQAKQIASHYLRIGHNEGYVEGRKNAHIPAKDLGLPSSMDYKHEWGKEDEEKLCAVISLMKSSRAVNPFYDKMCLEGWLKSLRRQTAKAELTLLDKNIINAAVAFVEQNNHFNYWGGIDKQTVIKALRSLKPSWKPSEEQMKAILDAMIPATGNTLVYLNSLYEQLKAL